MRSSNLASESGTARCAAAPGGAVPLEGGVPSVGDITRGEARPVTITPPTLPSF